jgi:hypothetical protein
MGGFGLKIYEKNMKSLTRRLVLLLVFWFLEKFLMPAKFFYNNRYATVERVQKIYKT